jgi:predicted PurR-regulated permease PerM
VRWGQRLGVTPPATSLLLMLLLAAGLGGAALGLAAPAREWMAELPRNMREAERELRSVMRSFEEVRKAAEQVDDLADVVSGEEPKSSGLVVDSGEKRGVLAGAGSLVGSALVCWFLLGFMLASHDSFLRSLVRTLPHLADKKVAVEVLRSIEREISRYLTTITLINAGLGIAIGATMYALDVPNPILWGVMAMLLNYVPYAGAIVGAGVVGLVALMSKGSDPSVLVVPISYIVLSGLEGMLITPAVLGRRMQLRPVAVLVALLFWGWLWGIAGALLAVPMLVVLRILCEHVEFLQPVGQFLGDPLSTPALPSAEAVPPAPEAEPTRGS